LRGTRSTHCTDATRRRSVSVLFKQRSSANFASRGPLRVRFSRRDIQSQTAGLPPGAERQGHTKQSRDHRTPSLLSLEHNTAGTRLSLSGLANLLSRIDFIGSNASRFDDRQHKKPGPPRTPGREPTRAEASRRLGQLGLATTQPPCGFLRAVLTGCLPGPVF
jgi:hypothetical protein